MKMINNADVLEVQIELSNKKIARFTQYEIEHLEMIESIFSFFMYGSIQIHDMYGYLENFILTGNEKIKIIYGRGKKVEKYFNIHSVIGINRLSIPNQNEKRKYTLQIVEDGFKKFAYSRYSRSWGDAKISDIVSHIVKHMIDRKDAFIQYEKTKESINYVMSNTSPAAALQWLLPRSSGDETALSGYLFFSNTQGLNYLSIEKLLNEKIKEKDGNGNIIPYEFNSNDTSYVNRIIDYSYRGIDYELIKNLIGGIATGYDIEINRHIKYQWQYKDIVKKYTSFGKYTLLPDISGENVEVSYYDDITKESLQNIVDYSFIKKYIRLCTMDVEPMYAYEGRYAGMISYLSWPSGITGGIVDQSLNGKWLLLSVKNIFSSKMNGMWKQILTYSKNGYLDSDNIDLHKASKINVETGMKVFRKS